MPASRNGPAPKPFAVLYIPASDCAELEREYGDLWMDHDPEHFARSADFATEAEARAFAASPAHHPAFTSIEHRTRIRSDGFGGWDYDTRTLDWPEES